MENNCPDDVQLDRCDEIVIRKTHEDRSTSEHCIKLNQLLDFILDSLQDCLVTEHGDSVTTYSKHSESCKFGY